MNTLRLNTGAGQMVEVECDGPAMLARIKELDELGFVCFRPDGSWALTHKATLFLFAEGPRKPGPLKGIMIEPEVANAFTRKAIGGVHRPRVDAEPTVPPVPVPDPPSREWTQTLPQGFWWGFTIGLVFAMAWPK